MDKLKKNVRSAVQQHDREKDKDTNFQVGSEVCNDIWQWDLTVKESTRKNVDVAKVLMLKWVTGETKTEKSKIYDTGGGRCCVGYKEDWGSHQYMRRVS